MQPQATPLADPKVVLTKALLNAGRVLDLSQSALGEIIGKDRTSISRGLDPSSKAGELALLLIRCYYRSLFVLVGGRPEDMRHWMHTANRDLGDVPAQTVRSVQGLTRVLEYLDAMRGRA
jgi:hypothetical protein